MSTLLLVLTVLSALGACLMAGVFFAFSSFVMAALARLAPHQSVAAMQSINRAVFNPLFMTAFLGTAGTCAALLLSLPWTWHEPGSAYLLAGGVLYLAGNFLVTVAFNVPLNEGLDAVAPSGPEAADGWSAYLARWVPWNHVRTITGVAAAALLAAAACYQAHGPATIPAA